jgi:uncharacterized protein
MSKIKIHHNPSEEQLRELNVKEWPIWEKETSNFPWIYVEMEMLL